MIDAKSFKLGAEAMQGRIVALLMVRGQLQLAQEVLAMSQPSAAEPETFTIGRSSDGDKQR